MPRITIRDRIDDALSFDLSDLLVLIPPSIDRSWKVEYVECYGPSADQLHAFGINSTRMSDRQFHQVAAGIDQTIDGEFRAFLQSSESPSIVIRAMDNTLFEVLTDDPVLIEAIKGRFNDVTEDR